MNRKIVSTITTVALAVSMIGVTALTASAQNPVPIISNITPSVKTAGDTAFTLTVNGSNFVQGSVVRFDGLDRSTTYVSANRLTAFITASDLSSASDHNIIVFNPAPDGGTSNQVLLVVVASNSPPTINSISPSQVVLGGSSFNLVVNGSNFVASNSPSVVRVNGADRVTTVISSTQLMALIPASDISSTGIQNITVYNGGANNYGTSNAVSLTINQTGTFPVITSISPTSKVVGSSDFTLTVYGANFGTNSTVNFNGIMRSTTYISATQLQASIPASAVKVAEQQLVTVTNPGVGTSNGLLFSVTGVPGLPNTGIGPQDQPKGFMGNIGYIIGSSVLLVISFFSVLLARRFKETS